MGASPQLSEGYTEIANEILNSLAQTKVVLSHYEWKCLIFLLRKTYGWKKREDRISLSQFSQGTNIAKSHVSRAIKKLVSKNIITQIGKGYYVSYSYQKDYTTWQPLPNQVTLPEQVICVTQSGNSPLPNQVKQTTKETNTKETNTKETNTKETPLEAVVNKFFDLTDITDKKERNASFPQYVRSAKTLLTMGSKEEVLEKLSLAKEYFKEKGLDWSLNAVIRHWSKLKKVNLFGGREDV